MKLTLKNLPNLKYKKQKYTRLEYISGGTGQFIDTGIVDSTHNLIDVKTYNVNQRSGYHYGGFGPSTCMNSIYHNSIVYGYASWQFQPLTNVTFVEMKQEKIDNFKIKITVNGIEYIKNIPQWNYQIPARTILLFGTWSNALTDSKSTTGTEIRIYYFRIKDIDGTVLANLIPAQDCNGINGLYDTISDRFLTNCGTGVIGGGPVVSTFYDNTDILIDNAKINNIDSVVIDNCANIDSISFIGNILKNNNHINCTINELNTDKFDTENDTVQNFLALLSCGSIDQYGNIQSKPNLSGTFHIRNYVSKTDADLLRETFGQKCILCCDQEINWDDVVMQTLDPTKPGYSTLPIAIYRHAGLGHIVNIDESNIRYVLTKQDIECISVLQNRFSYQNGGAINGNLLTDIYNIMGGGQNQTYKLDNFNFLSALENCVRAESHIITNNKDISSATLPPNILSVSISMFQGCSNIEIDELPDSITCIAENAFAGCTKVNPKKLPDNLREIRFAAFQGAPSISFDTIPESVSSIGYSAFYGTDVQFAKLPDNLKELNSSTFYNCKKLCLSALPPNLKYFNGDTIFTNCENLSISAIPASIQSTRIGNSLFQNCYNITLTSIPSCTQEIGTFAFANCTKCHFETLPTSLRSIDRSAFQNTKIDRIETMPYLSSIGYDVFYSISNLVSVGDLPALTSINSTLFAYCRDLSSIGEMPNVLSVLGGSIFRESRNLRTIGGHNYIDLHGAYVAAPSWAFIYMSPYIYGLYNIVLPNDFSGANAMCQGSNIERCSILNTVPPKTKSSTQLWANSEVYNMDFHIYVPDSAFDTYKNDQINAWGRLYDQGVLHPMSKLEFQRISGVELVGSSVTLNNGILTNFTRDSYGQIPEHIFYAGQPWEAVLKMKSLGQGRGGIVGLGSASGYDPISIYTTGNNLQFNSIVNGVGSYIQWDTTTYPSNKAITWTDKNDQNYKMYKIKSDGKQLTAYVDTGTGFELVATKNNIVEGRNTSLYNIIGAKNGNDFLAEVDLNYTYIKTYSMLWEGVEGAYDRVNS